MIRIFILMASVSISSLSYSDVLSDKKAIKQAAINYIESQHNVSPDQMKKGLHRKLKKRTYWQDQDGKEFVMETDYNTMVKIAGTYNKSGDRFPLDPRIEIEILDVDQRVASIKLTADECFRPEL